MFEELVSHWLYKPRFATIVNIAQLAIMHVVQWMQYPHFM